ncbi:MAG: RlmE family RNA methyltransferase [Thiotrichales bacterium]|nr:RlmE family RNA methyltransferase [Thiotrichales bacterium]
MSKSRSSNRWMQRQKKDPFVKQARDSHYRSRAVYKLQDIDKKHGLFKPGFSVLDLGAAPGSWSQYAAERIGAKGRILAVDILEMEPINGVEIIRGDFTERPTLDACLNRLGGAAVDIVISDLAPNLTGIRDADQAKSMYLAELVLDLARHRLKPGGTLLLKVFQGAGLDALRSEINESFQYVSAEKPRASRTDSREFYILARHINI